MVTEIENEVLFRVVNKVAIITLNRPQALNALTHNIVRSISAVLERIRTDDEILALVFEGAGQKGFCAGGDVRKLYDQARTGEREGPDGWLQFFAGEYTLDYAIHQFHKPVVALMDGITMGGGMGLAQGASLRIATTRTKIAMPETRIGLLPDVGATRFMSRMDAKLELFVGLTGASLNGLDAKYCQLADVVVEAESLANYEKRLQNVQWTDNNVLGSLRSVFITKEVEGKGAIESLMPLVSRHFRHDWSVKQIAESLKADLNRTGHIEGDQAWLKSTYKAMVSHSPLMLAVTREALLRGRELDLAQCFRQELNAVARALEEGDFCEGVRAHLVDKDQKPEWKLQDLFEVWPEHIEHYLSSPWSESEHPLAQLGA